jgi:two-component system nitrogen regulation response regulator NtrX
MAERSPAKTPLLVVDDDADIRLALEMLLQYEGYEVWTARDGREALARIERESAAGRPPALVVTDVKMPEIDGLALLERLAGHAGAPPVIVISGHADVAMAVEAVRKGAADFLEKPLDQNRVLVSVGNALRARELAAENRGLRRQIAERWQLVGDSPAMVQLRAQVARVAEADAPVLVSGENGTGKEIVARNLHLTGPRVAGPFVPVNCAAIPHELVESELFGHEKGSFTGAAERRIGHFESASGGTLFLDEIGDMPLAAQAKVLRALETREIMRVGGAKPIPVDIRVVAATNADLARAVEAKTFRMDLFYRLNVIPLRVPALRERAADVPALAAHFLAQISAKAGRTPPALSAEAAALLAAQEWPGNVRQLRNVLEAAQVFADGPLIGRDEVEQVLAGGPGLSAPRLPAALSALAGEHGDPFQAETFERFKDLSEALFLRLKLQENEGNVKRTAERLGMQRSHMYKKIERYGLRS